MKSVHGIWQSSHVREKEGILEMTLDVAEQVSKYSINYTVCETVVKSNGTE